MDLYNEKEQAQYDYFYNEMIDCKENALKKFKSISGDSDILEKFAKMLIDADSECCESAYYFLFDFFGITEIEKFAILEHFDKFRSLLIEEREE